MGCGASSAGSYAAAEPSQLPSLETLERSDGPGSAPAPASPDDAPSSQAWAEWSASPAPATQWDQLAPLLPLRALRQITPAGQVLGRKSWEQTLPGAVLCICLHGLGALCAQTLSEPGPGGPVTAVDAARCAQKLAVLLDELLGGLVAAARAQGGDVVHFVGELVICAFPAEAVSGGGGGGGGDGGGKEDELRGQADSQCVAACRCALQIRSAAAAWSARRGAAVSASCGVGVGETAWLHLNAPPSRQCSDHFRAVVLRGSAVEEASRALMVANAQPADHRIAAVSADVWEIVCDTLATERVPGEHPWAADHRVLTREIESGVSTGAGPAEGGEMKPPSAVAAGLAEAGAGVEEAHKGLLPYLTIARQRAGSPPELRPLVALGFRIELVDRTDGTQAGISNALLNRMFGAVCEAVHGANGVVQHSMVGHSDPHATPGTAAAGGVHWSGMAVFGLTAVELDIIRPARCALRLAQALEAVVRKALSASLPLGQGQLTRSWVLVCSRCRSRRRARPASRSAARSRSPSARSGSGGSATACGISSQRWVGRRRTPRPRRSGATRRRRSARSVRYPPTPAGPGPPTTKACPPHFRIMVGVAGTATRSEEEGAGVGGVAGGSAGSTCIAHVDAGLKEQLAASMAGAPTPALPALHLYMMGGSRAEPECQRVCAQRVRTSASCG